MPPIFQPAKIIQAKLDVTPITNGQVYFVQDTEKMYFDYNGVRTEFRDIIVLSTEAERFGLIAPKNKFYFVLESSSLWFYQETWYQLSGTASVEYKEVAPAENIESIELDETVASVYSIIAINVDNSNLMRNTFSLGEDMKTITFIEPISCELGIEVIYFEQINSSDASGAATTSLDTGVVTLSTTNSRSVVSTTEKDLVLTSGKIYSLSLTGHTNLSFGGWTDGVENTVILYLSVPDSYTLTLPANIKWKGGGSPALEVDGTYRLVFNSIDAGLTIYGSIDKYI